MFRQRLYPVVVRLRLGLWPIVQTALAASVAWVLAVLVVGYEHSGQQGRTPGPGRAGCHAGRDGRGVEITKHGAWSQAGASENLAREIHLVPLRRE